MSTTDRPQYFPTTRDLHAAFAEEIAALGGTLPDVYDDGDRLYARAVLPRESEVRPDDQVRAGVAIRASATELLVHPYTFRQVCSNGAIAAHALGTERIERTQGSGILVPEYESAVTLASFRRAVQSCASERAFTTVVDEMRSAASAEADMAVQLISVIARMPAGMASQWVPQIFLEFRSGGDSSAFGLMNAVTAVARGVRDPETRWRLEELGGTMPARLARRPKPVTGAAALVDA